MKSFDYSKYVCHYTTKETLLEKIFPTKLLRTSPLGLTNDPREYKHRLFNITSRWLLEDDGFIKTNNRINKIMQNNCRILSFTQDVRPDDPKNTYKGYMHPRMWAQYAGEHTGVCIIFNKARLLSKAKHTLESLGTFYYGKVNYIKRPTSKEDRKDFLTIEHYDEPLENVVNNHIEKYYKELFFEKNINWADENEFRFILISLKESEKYIFINIEDTIEGIVLGVDFPDVYHPSLIPFCKQLSISVGHIQWDHGDAYIGRTIFTPIDDKGYQISDSYHFDNSDFSVICRE